MYGTLTHIMLKRTTMILAMTAISAFGWNQTDGAASPPALRQRGPIQAVASLIGRARKLPPHFYGYNVNLTASDLSWHEPKLIEAVQRLFPGNLRYPGGTVANYWNWKTGQFVENQTAFKRRSLDQPTPNRLADFKLAIDATGAEPIYVLNMLTSDSEDQLAMLRHARDLGLPVRFVELGNEFYLTRKDYIRRFPTAEDYGRQATRWISRIKRDFPEARIAAVGAMKSYQQAERRATWNNRLITTLQGADAIVMHVYAGSGLTPIMNRLHGSTQTQPEGTDHAQDPWYALPETQQQQLEVLNSPQGAETFLSVPFQVVEGLHQEIQTLRGLPVWVTEYNLFDRVGPVKGSWGHGLFTATMLGLFLDEPSVAFTCCHVIGSPLTSFTALFTNTDPFRASIVAAPVRPFTPTAIGITLGTFGQTMRAMRSVQSIAFKADVPLDDSFSQRVLCGWVFADPPRQRAILINLGNETVRLDVRALGIAGCKYEQMSARLADTVTDADTLRRHLGEVTGELPLPPYSLTAVHERAAENDP